MTREHFRGTVWPKGEVAPGNFKYVVIGVVVTDTPIDVGFTHSDGYLDGETFGGLLPLLQCLPQCKTPYTFGEAESFLCSLAHCKPTVDGPVQRVNVPLPVCEVPVAPKKSVKRKK